MGEAFVNQYIQLAVQKESYSSPWSTDTDPALPLSAPGNNDDAEGTLIVPSLRDPLALDPEIYIYYEPHI